MNEPARHSRLLFDVGPCPICGDGLRGVRICCGEPVIVCDECDAVWSSPALSDRISTTADPPCSRCQRSLWGDQAHWANRAEVQAAGWWPHVRQSAGDGATTGALAAGAEYADPPDRLGVAYQGAVFVLLLLGAAVAALAVL